MENDAPNEDAVIEALTLTYVVDRFGVKIYRNKDGDLHRVHGPAVIDYAGNQYWYKNGKLHREDGPAITYPMYPGVYIINGNYLTKEEFIQWQIENGINPTE